jgi:transposase
VPDVVRACLGALGTQLLGLKKQILELDRMIMAWYRSNETSRRLHYIPGVGPLLATALVANVADPGAFRSGRNFSAWIGLVPKQHSSGGKDRLGSISKQGDRYLRSLFVAGALSVIRYAKALPSVRCSEPEFLGARDELADDTHMREHPEWRSYNL